MTTKVKIDREILILKLGKLMKFIPGKSVVPAFNNLKLVIGMTSMKIIASDGHVQCTMTCPVEATAPFVVCIPAALLFKTISLFAENEVSITLKSETKIELKSGKSKYNITLDCDENGYPMMRMAQGADNEIMINQFYLQLGLRSAGKFVDDENANANMTAINIAEVDKRIVFTGLIKAMACRVAPRPISIGKWESVCIPTETAKKVISVLGDSGEVSVIHGGGHIVFFTSKEAEEYFEIMSVTSNAKFPDSELVFRNKPETTMTFNTIEFRDAVKRLRLYGRTGESPIFHILTDEDKRNVKLHGADTATGKDGEEIISPISEENPEISACFTNDLILQILTNVDTKEFKFMYTNVKNHPNFIIPIVNTEEEDIFSFLIGQTTPPNVIE